MPAPNRRQPDDGCGSRNIDDERHSQNPGQTMIDRRDRVVKAVHHLQQQGEVQYAGSRTVPTKIRNSVALAIGARIR